MIRRLMKRRQGIFSLAAGTNHTDLIRTDTPASGPCALTADAPRLGWTPTVPSNGSGAGLLPNLWSHVREDKRCFRGISVSVSLNPPTLLMLHCVPWIFEYYSTYSPVYLHQLLVYFFQRHPCWRRNGFRVYVELDLWPLTCISLVIISFFYLVHLIDLALLPLCIMMIIIVLFSAILSVYFSLSLCPWATNQSLFFLLYPLVCFHRLYVINHQNSVLLEEVRVKTHVSGVCCCFLNIQQTHKVHIYSARFLPETAPARRVRGGAGCSEKGATRL